MNSPTPPHPQMRLAAAEAAEHTLLTWNDVRQGINRLLSLANRQFDVYDRDLSLQDWDGKHRIELLERALIEHQQLQVRIAVLDLSWVERHTARLTQLLRYRGHQIAIQQLGEAPPIGQAFIVVDRQHGLKRTEMVRSSGHLWFNDSYKSRTYSDIFEEGWARGGQRYFPESFGL